MFWGCAKAEVPVLFAAASPNADGCVPAKAENPPPEPALNAPPDVPGVLVVPKAGVVVDMEDCPKTEPVCPGVLVLPNTDVGWVVWPKADGFCWAGPKELDPNADPPLPPEPKAEVPLLDPNAEPVVDPNAPKPVPVAAGCCPKAFVVVGWFWGAPAL